MMLINYYYQIMYKYFYFEYLGRWRSNGGGSPLCYFRMVVRTDHPISKCRVGTNPQLHAASARLGSGDSLPSMTGARIIRPAWMDVWGR